MQNQSNPYSGHGENAAKLADKATQTAEQVKTAAVERVQSVRDRAQTGIDQGRTQVADRIRHVSSALRSASDNLREEDEFIAGYVETASERIERIASYVSEADPRAVLHDVEDFARQRPAWFFGGAFLLGLAAGRFLKASGDQRESALELDDSDIEEIRGPRYRRPQPYGQQSFAPPITPSATIPVTQASERSSGASPSMSGSPSGSLAGSSGYGGSTRAPATSTGNAREGSTGVGNAREGSLGGSVERDIFDIPGSPSGPNRSGTP